jgi:hypothetical protein
MGFNGKVAWRGEKFVAAVSSDEFVNDRLHQFPLAQGRVCVASMGGCAAAGERVRRL